MYISIYIKAINVIFPYNKNVGYIKPTMNCYLRNGCLSDPNFIRHKLYRLKQYQYLLHPILWVVLNNIAIVNSSGGQG